MIKTHTEWEDSGYDCDHCGGQVLKRTDYETGQPTRSCYQCEVCGCQWTTDGRILRLGHGRSCRAAQQERIDNSRQSTGARTLFIVLGVVAILILTPLRGLLTLHWIVPFVIGTFVILTLIRLGRQQHWW